VPAPRSLSTTTPPRTRLDKWLWAARFFKTRALAAEAIERGRVSVNGQTAKASRELKPGDVLNYREQGLDREVQVLGLSNLRGPAPVAQGLYRETEASLARRQAWVQARRQGVEPALAHAHGRPNKHERQQLSQWQRWSASLDGRDTEPDQT
jgi:ribosome-associated heat shock protein Hsp15